MRNEDSVLSEIYKLLEQDSEKTLRDIFDKKIEEFGISLFGISKLINIDKSTLSRIIAGDSQKVDLFNLLKISQFLNVSVEEITQIYVSSLKPEFVGELEIARKANYLIKNFDLAALEKIGFIKNKNNVREIEKRIVTFFGLNSLFEYDSEISGVLFSKTKKSSHDKMREMWVRSAHFQFKKIDNQNTFDLDQLKLLIPKIRPYTRIEEGGLITVIKALYNVGVTVIVQQYLAKTQIMGGTFVIDNKPCIVLTNYNKRYPIVWTALMHELYHVMYDFEDLKSWKYHLTGEPDLLLMREEEADFFASEVLLSEEKLNYIKHFINNNSLVESFAKDNGIHSSIIYHLYCLNQEKENHNSVWGIYSKYIPSSEKALRKVSKNPFNKETILEEINEIKTVLEA